MYFWQIINKVNSNQNYIQFKRLIFTDWCAVLLCEALGAIGGMQQGAVSDFLPSFINKLCELNDRNEQSHTQIKVSVINSFYIFGDSLKTGSTYTAVSYTHLDVYKRQQ